MNLSDFTQVKNNNFNLIRMVAALSVLLAHSFALTGESTNKFAQVAGVSSGIAVDIFFITSGFLVTASLISRQSVSDFFWARFLRIYPALWVMLILTVFGLGVFFTSLSVHAYLSNSSTYNYFYKCGILISGITFNLPGVFKFNPFKYAVNGSLWSLPYEVKCYMSLGVIWLGLRWMKSDTERLFKLAILTSCVVLGIYVVVCKLNFPDELPRERWFFMFFYCAIFYLFREYIRLSRLTFWLFLIILTSTILFVSVQPTHIDYVSES